MSLDKTSDEFGTPRWLYDLLDEEFQFTIDAAASDENAKHINYVTKEDDAFKQDYSGERVFCNPPYSRGLVKQFVELAYHWTEKDCPVWVMVLPTRTEQDWFHRYIKFPRVVCYFIRGRVAFVGGEGSARDSHMILVFRNAKFCGWQKPKEQRRDKGA